MSSIDSPSVGFLILSHDKPIQMVRLTRKLTEMYNDPLIVIHHDLYQSTIDPALFPSNCHFVADPLRTGWGKWTLVEAMLKALKELYRRADPDYFYLLSATDYPVMSANAVLEDLRNTAADAFINRLDLVAALAGETQTEDKYFAHYRTAGNLKLAQDRYLRAQVKMPMIRFRPPRHSSSNLRYPRLGGKTLTLPFNSLTSPFNEQYKCYVGSQWFIGSRRAARKLLNPNGKDAQLKHHYHARVVPDESYVQTVLCNDPSLKVFPVARKFVVWGGAHPKQLGMNDLASIASSECHFARKFSMDDPVLDRLDEMVSD